MTAATRQEWGVDRAGYGPLRPMPRPRTEGMWIPGSFVGAGQSAIYLDALADNIGAGRDSRLPELKEASDGTAWLEEVYSLVASGDPDTAIDLVFENIDEMLLEGHFDACNELLLAVDVKRLDTNLLVALLSVTRDAKAALSHRDEFVRRVKHRLESLAPKRRESLLAGLL